MDPKACWKRLMDAVADGEWGEADEAASDLMHWRDKGGFRAEGIPSRAWSGLEGIQQLCRLMDVRTPCKD